MAEPHELLNGLDERSAAQALERCCGARRWVAAMLARRPFASTAALLAAADEVWRRLEAADQLEAFAHHPAIGGDLTALRDKFAASLSDQEQAGVRGASEPTLEALRDGNLRYREKFGYVFLVCATGKSAEEMLALLRARLANDPARELSIAAAEHEKITRIRLEKMR